MDLRRVSVRESMEPGSQAGLHARFDKSWTACPVRKHSRKKIWAGFLKALLRDGAMLEECIKMGRPVRFMESYD